MDQTTRHHVGFRDARVSDGPGARPPGDDVEVAGDRIAVAETVADAGSPRAG